MLELRKKPNNGKYHIFLGDPMSSGVDKTVVEPGNAFSPGLWTFGVSLSVTSAGQTVSPETRELPLAFLDGRPPVTVSEYPVGRARVRSGLCHIGGPGFRGATYFRACVDGDADACCLMIRDIGPAGGKISAIDWIPERNTLLVDKAVRLRFETPVNVQILPADELNDAPAALVYFEESIRLALYHAYPGRAFSGEIGTPAEELPVDEAFARSIIGWDEQIPAKLIAPDPRIGRMWEQCGYHMMAAMECGLPRIGVANYPVFWMRDCVIVLRALDVMGRHDLARIGCDYLKPLIFSGGFGAESDNPGEGIWALYHHAKTTGDTAWLRGAFPHIVERVQWIERMLTTEEIIYRAGDSRTVFGQYCPGSTVVCLPHELNHIHGRMDWHSPDFYINCWAYAGLRLAADAAEMIGDADCARKWAAEAEALDRAIDEELLPDYGNERDSCATPYPCGALGGSKAELREAFARWYRANRLDEHGERVPEKLWTYFEAAQIHNAILLGLRDEAWACLDGYLSDPRWQDMSVFIEGTWNATEMLPFKTGFYGRGWLQEGATGANMPHNWTMSETTLMLRSLLITEGDEGLVLLGGVPDSWLDEGKQFGVKDMPTHFGPVSFIATALGEKRIRLEFSKGGDIPYTLGREDLEVVL